MICRILFTVLFFVQTVANAAPLTVMTLKDFKMVSLSATTSEMMYQGEKITIEKVTPHLFKLNGQTIEIKNTDTLEQVFTKTQTAYKAGGKRSASLDQIFIPRANALPPPLFILAFGGLLGAGIVSAIAKKNCGSSGFSSRTPSVEGASPQMDEEVEVSPER